MGDLATFRKVLTEHGATFQADQTISLIKRLRHNVIKTGLRSINVSYSCISLDDVAEKLGLERQEAVEGVVAKAIADGVIDATLRSASSVCRVAGRLILCWLKKLPG